MAKPKQPKKLRPAQKQDKRPGEQPPMRPAPRSVAPSYKPAGKLSGKVALITGGDSGIGRAVAQIFAREGADVAVVYLNEHKDAEQTARDVRRVGRKCLLIPGDVGDEQFCREAVDRTVNELGRLDILVNNAAEQHPQDDIRKISAFQLERTFRTNIFSFFYTIKAALDHMKPGSTIINTASVTAYRGSPQLLDYSSTKGAIVTLTRSLSGALAEKQVRVNAVAPGPIWTPLIPSTFPPDKVAEFGSDVPMRRAGEPAECAPCFVFLACEDSSYITGQVLHPNGGEIVNA